MCLHVGFHVNYVRNCGKNVFENPPKHLMTKQQRLSDKKYILISNLKHNTDSISWR